MKSSYREYQKLVKETLRDKSTLAQSLYRRLEESQRLLATSRLDLKNLMADLQMCQEQIDKSEKETQELKKILKDVYHVDLQAIFMMSKL